MVEGEIDELESLADEAQLALGYGSSNDGSDEKKKPIKTDDLSLGEAVVMVDSTMISRSVEQLRLFNRYELNLIAVASQGQRLKRGPKTLSMHSGKQ